MNILYRGVYVEKNFSENGPKLTVWGEFHRKNCESQSSDPLGNQSPPEHTTWHKNGGNTPKRVFSRAWQEKL